MRDATRLTSIITTLPEETGPWQIEPQYDQLIADNARARTERDQLAAINAQMQRKLYAIRNGVAVLAEGIKEKE